jgi:hypothetical protein
LLNNTIISSLGRQSDAQSQTDVLFQPPVDGIGLLHWHRLELARSVGLKHAHEVLAQPHVLARLRPVLPTSTLTASKSQA